MLRTPHITALTLVFALALTACGAAPAPEEVPEPQKVAQTATKKKQEKLTPRERKIAQIKKKVLEKRRDKKLAARAALTDIAPKEGGNDEERAVEPPTEDRVDEEASASDIFEEPVPEEIVDEDAPPPEEAVNEEAPVPEEPVYPEQPVEESPLPDVAEEVPQPEEATPTYTDEVWCCAERGQPCGKATAATCGGAFVPVNEEASDSAAQTKCDARCVVPDSAPPLDNQ